VERDCVGEERVDQDRVPTLLVPIEVAAAVVDFDLETRVARQVEEAVGDVNDDRVELDAL
jgi:hypothetical protein